MKSIGTVVVVFLLSVLLHSQGESASPDVSGEIVKPGEIPSEPAGENSDLNSVHDVCGVSWPRVSFFETYSVSRECLNAEVIFDDQSDGRAPLAQSQGGEVLSGVVTYYQFESAG